MRRAKTTRRGGEATGDPTQQDSTLRRSNPQSMIAALFYATVLVADPRPPLMLVPVTQAAERNCRLEFSIAGVLECPNPYDPDAADVRVMVRTPNGGRLAMPAFYMAPFEVTPRRRGEATVDWLYPTGRPEWRVRFTPTETGSYSFIVTATIGKHTLQSEPVRLTVKPSSRTGFVRVSRRDPRFLELDDGRPFFAVGQNVAFIKDVHETRGIFRKLAANGANYVRVWTCCEDWGMAIEARKSAWARSWDWKPPFVTDADGRRWVVIKGGPVTCNPTQRMGLRPNTRYRLSATVRGSEPASAISIEIAGQRIEWHPQAKPGAFSAEFTTGPDTWWLETIRLSAVGGGEIALRDLSLKEVGSHRELLWDADPDRAVLGNYNQADCAMLDAVVEEAERVGIRLQLCLLARDLYMDRLKDPASAEYDRAMKDALRLVRYAVARWGYSTSVAAWEYWNEMDPGRPTSRFYDEVGAYIEQTDPFRRLRTTSAWADAPNDWRHARIDVANMHWYLRPAEGELYRDEVVAVLRKARQLREAAPAKPVLFAEFGLAQDNWQPSPDMRADAAYVHLHNALWASALSGLSGTVMAWWWEDIDARDAYRHYRGVSAFVRRVPWLSGLETAQVKTDGERWRAVGLATESAAYVWVQDSYAVRTGRTATGEVKESSVGVHLTVGGLRAGTYRIEWVDTDTGQAIRADSATTANGLLQVTAPPFRGDVACAIERASGQPRSTSPASRMRPNRRTP